MSVNDLYLDPYNQARFPGGTEMEGDFRKEAWADQGSEMRDVRSGARRVTEGREREPASRRKGCGVEKGNRGLNVSHGRHRE